MPSSSSHEAGAGKLNRKRRPLLLLASLLLVAVVAGVAAGAVRARRSRQTAAVHGVLRASCSSTLYPDLCYSSFAGQPSLLAAVTDQKDVVHGASACPRALCPPHLLHRAEDPRFQGRQADGAGAVRPPRLPGDVRRDPRGAGRGRRRPQLLRPRGQLEGTARHAADLKTLLSAAITNQDTCLDGFSHDSAERRLRDEIREAITHVSHMCSNALALVTNMTDGDISSRLEVEQMAASGRGHRKLLSGAGGAVYGVDEEGFPTWMSAADRRLLQQSTVTPNVVVAADGSGDFKTVSAAVAAAPSGSSKRYVIRIKAGTYRENVDVPKSKTNIMFVGDGRGSTVITGSRNVVDGSTTFNSATVAVVGGGFLARDLTFQNTAGPSKHQAVALRVGSDLSAFYQCNIVAYQDTLYNCNLQARKPNPGQKNMVTAQGREDPNQNTGISIQGCTISGASDLSSSTRTFLGRPWKKYSRTVVMQSTITSVIDPAGWFEWSGSFALDTLTYREYQNTGAGAGTSGRVNWKGYKVITSASEAQQYTVGNFIGGSGWLGATGFPFKSGL
ncbi:unnamed protein product [Spirodela intermedia]|uniref:Pectinesterase n=1 Tax=Spirodela intermedia TaxID=51605 RepID=A0A7I8J227_SPIIN|nr:unnamed protein product [Spirodela intermedia]CAA6664187.1 unnamed protein product [Spirodela intermedia]